MPEIIAALGWPHFAFAFGVVFLLVFHAQLRALLGRITSIDKTGRLLAFPVDQGIKHVNGPGLTTEGGGFCHVWLRTEA